MRIPYYAILMVLMAIFFFCACAPPSGEAVVSSGADGPATAWVGGLLR